MGLELKYNICQNLPPASWRVMPSPGDGGGGELKLAEQGVLGMGCDLSWGKEAASGPGPSCFPFGGTAVNQKGQSTSSKGPSPLDLVW